MVQIVRSESTSFSDGFENGLTNWTGATPNPNNPIVSSEKVHLGSNSLKINKADAGGSNYAYKTLALPTRLMYFQIYASLSAPIPYGDNRFMICADKNSNFVLYGSVYYNKTSYPKLHIIDAVYNKGFFYDISWTPNTWHAFEVMINATSNGGLSMWYDGAFAGRITGDFSSVGDLGTLIVGDYNSEQAVTNYIDDVSISLSSPTSGGSTYQSPIVYFKSTFSYAGTGYYAANQNWINQEPVGYVIERGTWQWINTQNSADMKLVKDPANQNNYCLEVILDSPGTRPLNINQQAKLYNIPSRETQNWNGILPNKEVYYTVKYWFPKDFSVAFHSWRLIWQLNGEEDVYGNPNYTFYPQLALVFGENDLQLQAPAYYYPDWTNRAYHVVNNVDLPKEQWVTFMIYVKQGSGFRVPNGTVRIWINGVQVYSSNTLSTATFSGTPYDIWSIGNYGGPLEAQNQFILIKDVMATNYPTT